jgi:hypothetical protein
VGGSAAALWANHRSSFDHDHVLADLSTRPADSRTIQQLDRYKSLDTRWADWSNVAGVCRSLAVEMVQ